MLQSKRNYVFSFRSSLGRPGRDERQQGRGFVCDVPETTVFGDARHFPPNLRATDLGALHAG